MKLFFKLINQQVKKMYYKELQLTVKPQGHSCPNYIYIVYNTVRSCSNLQHIRGLSKRKWKSIYTSVLNQKVAAVLSHCVITCGSSVLIYNSIKWIPYLLTSSHSASCSFTCKQVATDNDTIWKITHNMLQHDDHTNNNISVICMDSFIWTFCWATCSC